MYIRQASQESGLPRKTIRYYEDIGLIRPDRCANGYREYDHRDVHKLRFLQRARSLGFSIESCRRLLSLYEDRSRASADVKKLANAHIVRIEHKLAELQTLHATLVDLATSCHGDDRPDCPILDELAGQGRVTDPDVHPGGSKP